MTEPSLTTQQQVPVSFFNRYDSTLALNLRKVLFALALFGVAWILLSSIWLWITFLPPSIGYFPGAVYGKAHVPASVFERMSWWMATCSIIGGLLLVIGFFIHSKYTIYGYFAYMIISAFQAIFSLCFMVFFLLLALGSQGHLDYDYCDNSRNTYPVKNSINAHFCLLYGCCSMANDEQLGRALGIGIFMLIYSFITLLIEIGTSLISWKVYQYLVSQLDEVDFSPSDNPADVPQANLSQAIASGTAVPPKAPNMPISGPPPDFSHLTGFTQSERTRTLDSNQRFTNFPTGYAQRELIQKTQEVDSTEDGETHYEKVNTLVNPAETKKGKSSNQKTQKNSAANQTNGTLKIEIDSKDVKPSASGPGSVTAIANV